MAEVDTAEQARNAESTKEERGLFILAVKNVVKLVGLNRLYTDCQTHHKKNSKSLQRQVHVSLRGSRAAYGLRSTR